MLTALLRRTRPLPLGRLVIGRPSAVRSSTHTTILLTYTETISDVPAANVLSRLSIFGDQLREPYRQNPLSRHLEWRAQEGRWHYRSARPPLIVDFGGVEEANESGDVKKEELVIVPVADANVTAVKPKDQGGLKGAGVDLSGADCGAGYY